MHTGFVESFGHKFIHRGSQHLLTVKFSYSHNTLSSSNMARF
ncbi:Uncharacterised protein [Vibrio cholerae]|nr:Uncharacterised protein [Vibrio cholerae]